MMKADRQQQAIEDEVLVRAVQAGDEKAFEKIVRKYQKQIANIVYLTLGSRDDADDVTQEVFIRAYRSIARFTFDAPFFSWLYRIAMNLCIDETRKRKIKRILSLDFLTEEGIEDYREDKETLLPSDEFLREEDRIVVRQALRRLSEEHRKILVLREYEDYGYNEIAETLDISLEAVKSRLFRARSEMRKLLQGHFKEKK
jgi:RNA polymerase sigma-70 factor (ECF subfamily)